jgi:hypothetical protein
MIKKIAGTTLLVLFTMLLYAQKHANIWYFGHNDGLNFNTNPPTMLTDGQLSSYEACASIADESGHLLFYTDGVTVYNKQHQVMANGSGLFGHISSTQGALIIPWPERPNIYYIFTADAEESDGIKGYNYSIVDLNNNGGLGEVTEKNKPLYSPSTEKLTVALHRNGQAWWVITKQWNNNLFSCYLIDKNGLNLTPVISAAGQTLYDASGYSMSGALRLSHNLKKLVMQAPLPVNARTEVFDFDNATGIVSNGIALNLGRSYGVEFSPDSRFLYLSFLDDNYIGQFDLSSYTNAATLAATRRIIATMTYPNGLQLGPDGKIYVASYFNRYLSIINTPNQLGSASGYQANVIDLGSAWAMNLPNIVSPILNIPVVLPVRWGYFRARKEEQSHRLEWQTLQEDNASTFLVERSAEGLQWETISVITAKNEPAGASYYYTDIQPLKGNNYYRLVQKDADGKVAYSKIIQLKGLNNKLTEAAIVPLKGGGIRRIRITLPDEDEETYEVMVQTTDGKMIEKASLRSQATVIALPENSRGLYIVTLVSTKGKQYSKKVYL